ncbi:IS1182 family transposase [Streptomyces verrucosisporus]|uniref:IS1182 family transposase n=1 Tax=Streptomyces verrucosisporus TaxID=1695161 RepID=UPI0019D20B83|nr:IS1182 family transposase [Streptomyces verrucosisporus]MBN3933293.1 IS1182 family transposase [Streptomyces verrucosisporus]
MSLRESGLGEIPAETVRVARAVCPDGTLAMRLRDEFGDVFSGEAFADLFPRRGRPAVSPGVLALVTVLQFAEGLSDRQAAEAVRVRIDWKYALGLELMATGFDFSVLSEFRARLVEGRMADEIFEQVLRAARERGLLKTAGRARTDSTKVLAAIRAVNHLEMLGETLRAALNALAAAVPEWLTTQAVPEWFDRYGHRVEESRLPRSTAKRREWAQQAGVDGTRLLEAVFSPRAPSEARSLQAVELLRQTWVQNYQVLDGQVSLRDAKNVPPGRLRPFSPYDPHARAGNKRGSTWTGYAVQLTETCESDAPNLITHVATTDASVSDMRMTDAIRDDLRARGRLPAVHLVDANYVDAQRLAASHQSDSKLVGPIQKNKAVQSSGRFTTEAFTVDWDEKRVTCPNGQVADTWYPRISSHGIPVVRVRFESSVCRACPDVRTCAPSKLGRGREIMLRERDAHDAIRQNRADQQDPEWQSVYQHRQGIEATISQGVRAFGLRRSRYLGQPKTSLQHLYTATAMNLTRLDAWITGTPRAGTRVSRFERLSPAA